MVRQVRRTRCRAGPRPPQGRDPSSGGRRARGAGAFGGRLDHALANLNTLHRHAGPPLALAGEGNLARLLPPGRSELAVDRGLLGPACGLVALGAPATATSAGLRWNLGAARRAACGLKTLV
jgi:thiamine pyrophosphokinase